MPPKTSKPSRSAISKAANGALQAPTNFVDPGLSEPSETLTATHVFGYRARNSRNNLFYLTDKLIVYPAGSLGIVLDKSKNTQSIYTGHTDDVISLTIHKDKKLVATGQVGSNPSVHIWKVNDGSSSVSCEHIAKFDVGKGLRGIAALSFNPDASALFVVTQGENNDTFVYDLSNLQSPSVVASTQFSGDRALDVAVNPAGDNSFVISGPKFLKFMKLEGKTISSSNGIFGEKDLIQALVSVAYVGGNSNKVVTGTETGDLFFWDIGSRKLLLSEAKNDVHKGAVTAVLALNDGGLISAARDGKVIKWNNKMEQVTSFVLPNTFGASDPLAPPNLSVQNMDVNGDYVIVGSTDSSIYEIKLKSSPSSTCIHDAHHSIKEAETWGLDCSPSDPNIVASSSEDSSVRLWNIHTRSLLSKYNIGAKSKVCAFRPSSQQLAVGTEDGRIMIFEYSKDYSKLKPVPSPKQLRKGVTCLMFSPCGTKLAAGNWTQILVYDCKEYDVLKELNGHSGEVLHLDWSKDSKYLMSNSNDYEVLFWEVDSGKQQSKPSELKDVEWASYTCPISWPCIGVYDQKQKPGATDRINDGTDINCVAKNPKLPLLAAGTDSCHVQLFHFPCFMRGDVGSKKGKPDFKAFLGHSSHVTNVKFTCDGKYAISIGGLDGCVIVWKVDSDGGNKSPMGSRSGSQNVSNAGSPATSRKAEGKEKESSGVGGKLKKLFGCTD
ncbi:WD40-repeat-containing domain protein [Paraphysoderma sedebokerense]|nr:WD40-repeat-containing domain protein [Paraphysoderma sedebokerense]KAI9142884.1 WD40-repeat-containing domain protein [Paraphysoderma sedebokerense]